MNLAVLEHNVCNCLIDFQLILGTQHKRIVSFFSFYEEYIKKWQRVISIKTQFSLPQINTRNS